MISLCHNLWWHR